MEPKTLDDNKINQITEKLSHFLADTFVLYVKTLNFHWNMVGPEFFMYHKLLEKQYEDLAKSIDEIAERIRMLGKKAPATMQEYLSLSCLKEPSRTLTQNEMIQELAICHEAMVEHCHAWIKITDSFFDQGTSDMLVERIRSHAKEAWLLRSHLEK